MGISLKKIVKGVAKVGKVAAPILAATGVGAPLAMGIMAGSTLADKATDKGGLKKMKVFKQGILPTAAVGGGAVAAKALGATPGGALKLAGKVGKGALSVGKSAGSTLGKSAVAIGRKALKNPELALGAAGMIQNASARSKASGQRNAVADYAMAQMAQRAPIQQAIMQRLAAPVPTAPDLTRMFANPGSAY